MEMFLVVNKEVVRDNMPESFGNTDVKIYFLSWQGHVTATLIRFTGMVSKTWH